MGVGNRYANNSNLCFDSVKALFFFKKNNFIENICTGSVDHIQFKLEKQIKYEWVIFFNGWDF